MRFIVLTGLSGVGKTASLARLAAAGHPVLDLQALAVIRGSSFGRVGLTSSEPIEASSTLRAARDTRRRLPADQIPELLRAGTRGSLPVMSASIPKRPALYERFVRPTPEWFADSALGIFVHWGAYSVPAWAEPIGALGAFEDTGYWFAHNPYAEWYFNTIRIEGSPARVHHEEVLGGRPYDEFLDQWAAEAFDPADMMALFARAGAGMSCRPPSTTTASRCGMPPAPVTATRSGAGRNGT